MPAHAFGLTGACLPTYHLLPISTCSPLPTVAARACLPLWASIVLLLGSPLHTRRLLYLRTCDTSHYRKTRVSRTAFRLCLVLPIPNKAAMGLPRTYHGLRLPTLPLRDFSRLCKTPA